MIVAVSLEEKVPILWRLNLLSDPIGLIHEKTGDTISTRDSESDSRIWLWKDSLSCAFLLSPEPCVALY